MTGHDIYMDYGGFGGEPDEYSPLGRTKEKTMVEETKSSQRVVGFVLMNNQETLPTFIPYGHLLPPVSVPYYWSPVQVVSDDEQPRTLKFIAVQNRDRSAEWHKNIEDWTTLEWAGAMCGEAGEAANVAKKIKRHDTGITSKYGTSRANLLAALKREIGDTYLYLDLLAQREGLTLEECVATAFNEVSEREGFPQRI